MTTTTFDRRPSVLDRPLTTVFALNWEHALYVLLIAAALVTRFYDLGTRVMSHDESLHTQFAWYLYQGRGFQHSPLMHGVLRIEVTAFTYWLLGDNDFTSRIPTALMGVAAIGLMYFFRKWLGRAGALVGALLMLISPYMLYYSRYIRDEPFVVVWGLLMALCVIHYMETRAARYLYGLTAVTALFYTTMEASFIYIAIAMLFLGLHMVRELFAVRWPQPEYRRPFQIAFAVTMTAIMVAVGFVFYERQAIGPSATETAVPADPNAATAALDVAPSPFARVELIAGLVAGLGLIGGAYCVFRAFGSEMRRFPALDLLTVFGLFVLPQLTAFPMLALGRDPLSYTLPTTAGLSLGQALDAVLSSDAGVNLAICLTLVAISLGLGYLWNWRTFLICAGIFYGIYITLFTTFFTNGGGLASGIIGSLGYWLAQHSVRRGGQPWYYYAAINLPMYEFLPALGALFAAALGLKRWLRAEEAGDQTSVPISPSDTLGFPVIGYFGFWAVMSLLAFSIAGEKMPWLTTHITLPLILVSAWALGRFIDQTHWGILRQRRGWLAVVLLPVTVTALASVFGSLLGDHRPFQGSELPQLQATGVFISAGLVTIIGGAGLYAVGRELGLYNLLRLAVLSVFGLLALLTARAAFIAAYVNYDFANEFLVYAHGARGVKTVMEQVEDISERTTDGLGVKVAYDSDVSWPMTWYLRNFTQQSFYGEQPTREAVNAPVVIAGPRHWSKVESLLGKRYYQFEYIRMVWPMQDYFNLVYVDTHGTPDDRSDDSINWDRVRNALTDKDYRQALWNIWYNRDYTLYGELTNQNFDLSEWPVAERMRFYVRKDVAAQIWSYGVGPTALEAEVAPEDPYLRARQVITAARVWGREGVEPGSFQAPRGVAVAPDGSIYVADSRNHRIQKFDAQGNLLLAWGTFGSIETDSDLPGTFNEPWGVGVAQDGSVYVADTWNHRVQKFDANGQFIKMWGNFGQAESFDAFWGPRAIAVDTEGRVYVADTGNKRIVVFDADGNGLAVIGSGGSDPGFLDEPVGVAASAAGEVYVADTWNLRIQVFQLELATGEYLVVREWPIVGWYGQSLDNKPYIALDAQERVYVADPEGYRVLVFDRNGTFETTWGDFGTDSTAFGLVSGVAVGADGSILVADGGNHRVMQFPSLP